MQVVRLFFGTPDERLAQLEERIKATAEAA